MVAVARDRARAIRADEQALGEDEEEPELWRRPPISSGYHLSLDGPPLSLDGYRVSLNGLPFST